MSQSAAIRFTQDFSRRLFLSTSIAMALAAFLSLMVTVVEFNAGMRPFLEDKARAVAITVQRDIEYALQIGIPFDEIRGLYKHVNELVVAHPEIKSMRVISLADTQERAIGEASLSNAMKPTDNALVSNIIEEIRSVTSTIFGQSNSTDVVTVTVAHEGATLARIEATIDGAYLNGKMTSVFFDTLVILIAVALVALEVVVVVSASQLTGPFRLVETALYKRVAGDLRQYQIGRGSRLKTAFIQRLNAQNAHLRDRLTGSIRNLKQGAKRKALEAFGKERHLYVTDAQTGASIMDARIPLFVFSFAEELQKSFLLFVAEFHTKYDLFERHYDGVANFDLHVCNSGLYSICRPSSR